MKTELAQVWQQCLDTLERQFPKTNLENWLKTTKPLAVVEDTIIVGVHGTVWYSVKLCATLQIAI